jgi:GNAT superfamily N-acetyltransferase
VPHLTVHPLTADRWADLEALFGPRGAFEGCWCMYWRLKGEEFGRLRGPRAREALRELAGREPAPGLLAYLDGRPAGWCAVGPREAFGRAQRSAALRPVDDEPGCWAVPCFFVDRAARGAGIARALLEAAAAHAAASGARLLEGFPVEPPVGAEAAYRGVPAMFERAGFGEVARRSARRPVLRRRLT